VQTFFEAISCLLSSSPTWFCLKWRCSQRANRYIKCLHIIPVEMVK